ncbi:MAG: GtrA family protein [Oscillospiraceae bacterium]|nr:GtrA family protein [Oscillospiraceae bacterium]
MSEKKKEFLRTLKFLFFSVGAAAIQVGSFTLMEEVFHVTHWLSYLVSLILSIIWMFTLNRKYTFRSANNIPVAMLKTLAYYAVFTPLSTWWTAVLTGPNVGWNEYLVLAITMVTNCSTEYIFDRFVVFGGSLDTAVKK